MYPVVYDRLKQASLLPLSNGKIPQGIKKLYAAIIKFVIDFYESLEIRDPELYSKRDGEIKAEVFSQFPTKYQRPLYEADQKAVKKTRMLGILCVLSCS